MATLDDAPDKTKPKSPPKPRKTPPPPKTPRRETPAVPTKPGRCPIRRGQLDNCGFDSSVTRVPELGSLQAPKASLKKS